MRLLFTIAGRAGSKGIPGKNVREFCGAPLPLYALSAIDLFLKQRPQHDGDIAISSDCDTLLGILGNNAMRDVHLIRRSGELSGDIVSKVLVIRDCLHRMTKSTGAPYDAVIDLDITSPLRRIKDMDNLIEEFCAGDGYDAVFSVSESRRNPYFNMVKRGADADSGYELVETSDFTARQQAPEVFDINGSLYAYRPEFLSGADRLFDGRCGVVVMPDTGILDLDREQDFTMMEVIAAHLYNTDADYAEIRDHITTPT